jgi:fused signal recognition particle receptor
MAFNWFKKKKKEEKTAGEHSDDAGLTTDASAESADETPENAIDEAQIEAELEKAAEEAWNLSMTDDPDHETADAAPMEPASQGKEKGLLARLKRGLSKTRQILTSDIEDLFQGRGRIDDEMLEQLEELLITSDIGVQTTTELMTAISRKSSKIAGPEDLKAVIKEEILAFLSHMDQPQPVRHKPHVIMVIGVNGVGKTTTIGKLAARMAQEGHSTLIAAADTFRAAAIEQLAVWAERAGADLIRHKDNADPAAVVFDSLEAAQARGRDIVLVDTAGRLHTKVNLMEELKKIKRTITRKIADAPHEVLLVLDATTGQNAVSQAKLFNESIGVTGLVLTKLDGTAKGGVVVSICRELNLPLRFIGVGESIEDLQPFDARQFVEALF